MREIAEFLAQTRQELAQLETKLEARNRPTRERVARAEQRVGTAAGDVSRMEGELARESRQLEVDTEERRRLTAGLQGWRRFVARVADPLVLTTALLLATVSLGLNRDARWILAAEAGGFVTLFLAMRLARRLW